MIHFSSGSRLGHVPGHLGLFGHRRLYINTASLKRSFTPSQPIVVGPISSSARDLHLQVPVLQFQTAAQHPLTASKGSGDCVATAHCQSCRRSAVTDETTGLESCICKCQVAAIALHGSQWECSFPIRGEKHMVCICQRC